MRLSFPQRRPRGGAKAPISDRNPDRPITLFSIQLLRAVAASLVVLFHSHQGFATRVRAPTQTWETYVAAFGAVGVHIFFAISGLIMVVTTTVPGQTYSIKSFYRRRFIRIFPIYWLCAAMYLGVHAMLGDPIKIAHQELTGALLLWPADASRIIGPAWTLSYELFFYACFGLARRLGADRGLIALGIAFLTLIAIGTQVADKGPAVNLVTNPLLLEFLGGAAVGWAFVNRRLPVGHGGWLIGTSVAMFAAGLVLGYDSVPSVVAWGPPSVLLVAGLATLEIERPLSSWLVRLSRLGDSSYVLYLLHILIIAVAIHLSQFLPENVRPLPAVAMGLILPIAILISELVHRRIEQPFLRQVNRRPGATPGAESAGRRDTSQAQ